MPALLLRYLPHILGLLGLIAGLWWFGHSRYEAGQADVQARWDKAVVAAQIEADKKEAEHAAVASALQDELVRQGGRINAADSRARSLAERLRRYQARSCLPQAPGTAAQPDPAPGVPPGGGEAGTAVDAALEEALAAAGRDAARLGAWQDWWRQVSSD